MTIQLDLYANRLREKVLNNKTKKKIEYRSTQIQVKRWSRDDVLNKNR